MALYLLLIRLMGKLKKIPTAIENQLKIETDEKDYMHDRI